MAVIAGVVNGLFGTGGGIVIIFTLNYLLKKKKYFENDGEKLKEIMVMTMLSVLPMSIISFGIYWVKGIIDIRSTFLFLPGAVIGGLCGAFLMYRFDVKIIKNVFAATVIYAGIKMFFK